MIEGPTIGRSRSLRHGVSLLAVTLLLAPLDAAAQDLDTVEREVGDLQTRVAEATAAYEDVVARIAETEERLEQLATRQDALAAELDAIAEDLVVRARTVFKRGTGSVLSSILTADGPQAAVERATLMAAVAGHDQARLEAARNLRLQLDQTRTLVASTTGELDELRDRLDANRQQLASDLADAQATADALRRIEARKVAIDRGDQQGVYACIFDRGATHFRDTWGAPRSGGRRHKGTDVFAAMDAPIYAFTSGVVARVSNSRLGGIGLYINGDDGNQYYYAHINGVTDGIYPGRRVDAGEHVAYNGDTGNARGGAPHVHFQMHPGGGAPRNPYAWLAAACF